MCQCLDRPRGSVEATSAISARREYESNSAHSVYVIREFRSFILVNGVADVCIGSLDLNLVCFARYSRLRLCFHLDIKLIWQASAPLFDSRIKVDKTNLHPVLELELPARVYTDMLQSFTRNVVGLPAGL